MVGALLNQRALRLKNKPRRSYLLAPENPATRFCPILTVNCNAGRFRGCFLALPANRRTDRPFPPVSLSTVDRCSGVVAVDHPGSYRHECIPWPHGPRNRCVGENTPRWSPRPAPRPRLPDQRQRLDRLLLEVCRYAVLPDKTAPGTVHANLPTRRWHVPVAHSATLGPARLRGRPTGQSTPRYCQPTRQNR